MDYVDLNTVAKHKTTKQYKQWKEAIEEATGTAFEEFAENSPTAVPESEWQSYAEEEFDELFLTPSIKNSTVASYIDYKGWAEALQQDYIEVIVGGEVYYCRAY